MAAFDVGRGMNVHPAIGKNKAIVKMVDLMLLTKKESLCFFKIASSARGCAATGCIQLDYK